LGIPDHGGTISPRQALVSAPYAFQAARADIASRAPSGFTVSNGMSVISGGLNLAGALTMTGALSVAGSVTLNGGLTVSSPNTISGYGTIPIGGIIMWSGATVPDGWALCDGTVQSGQQTPAVRDRVIVGAGNLYTNGNTGGEAQHTLAVSEMPAHSHGHTVKTVGYAASWNGSSEATAAPNQGRNNGWQSWGLDNTGGSQPHENRPPYYALAFIMRVR